MRNLDPVVDLNKTIKSLNFYSKKTGISLAPCVRSQDFAARLLHSARYSFGEMCAYCRAGIKQAMFEGSTELRIRHFEDAYRLRVDCLPALNPFVAIEFQNIQVGEQIDIL